MTGPESYSNVRYVPSHSRNNHDLGLALLQRNGDYYVPYVSYEEAVKILHSGDVKFVVQAHSLSVWMTMKNGTMIKTVEPVIDMIWHDYDRCGDPCKDTIFAAE